MVNRQTIYIVGAGAVGKALAVFLKNEGKDIVILRGSVDGVPDCFEDIVVELSDDTVSKARIKVSTIGKYSALNGLVVLTNKSFGNSQIALMLRNKTNNSPIVVLQNGLNVEEPFIKHGFPQIYRCVLFATSQTLAENRLRFRPVSISPIGIIKGDDASLDSIVQQLSSSNFLFRAEKIIQPIIWTKVIVNSVFNSVCPLLETDNGIFHRDPAALNIARRVIAECITIAVRQDVFLNAEEVLQTLLMISKLSDGQLISTYQDILNKRRTEIKSLNFAICDIADELKMEDQVKETRLLGGLVLIKSGPQFSLPTQCP